MTRMQALAEAQRRWGQTAVVGTRRVRRHRFEVGTAPYQNGKQGYSKVSWEDAFMDADRQALKWKELRHE